MIYAQIKNTRRYPSTVRVSLWRASFLKQVHDTKRPLVITQHGKGVAVLLDVAEYESMQDKIGLYEDIEVSITQIDAGEGISHEAAKKKVLKKFNK